MLIDTHCHLDAEEFSADRQQVMANERAAGVSAVVVPAVDAANFSAVRACCVEYAECYPAYGIHPLYTGWAGESDLDILRAWLTRELAGPHRPVAVGEIGLDHFVPGQDLARQEALFISQLKLARDFDLPVILHVRRAVDQVLKCLRRIGVRGGIAHAFNGSRQQADEFIKRGFCLGFGGAMTFSGSMRIRRLAAELPLESIVLETDSPDMAPSWLAAGARNEPAELARIARVYAELRRLTAEEAIAVSGARAATVLALPRGDHRAVLGFTPQATV